MSTTSHSLTKAQWFRTLLSGCPHQVIGVDEPYLRRWYLIPRNRFLNLYLHHFLRSDDDRALHDHPWWFISWIIKGRYLEWTPGSRGQMVVKMRDRWSIAYRPSRWRHRVQLPSNPIPTVQLGVWLKGEVPAWTVILTGARSRSWGFYCPDRFVPWEEFESNGGCE